MCYVERTLNIHPPFVVSVTVLIMFIGHVQLKNVILISIFYINSTNENEIFQ